MPYLANENFPLESIQYLRNRGYDVVSVLEKSSGAKDYEVLAWARREGRTVLTFDRDYGELIYRLGLASPAGLVYFRFQPNTPEEPSNRLMEIIEVAKVPLEGCFTVLERGRARQRPLP